MDTLEKNSHQKVLSERYAYFIFPVYKYVEKCLSPRQSIVYFLSKDSGCN